jgi:hypothetical protein
MVSWDTRSLSSSGYWVFSHTEGSRVTAYSEVTARPINAGGFNGSMQHLDQTHIAMKTKAKDAR